MELIQLRVVSKNVELAGKGRVELDLVVFISTYKTANHKWHVDKYVTIFCLR